MSQEQLELNAKQFTNKLNQGLEGLSKDQQQAFLDGAFLALNSYFVLASPNGLTPFEIEKFMLSARSNVYTKTGMLDLEDSRMKIDMNDGRGVAAHYKMSAVIQELLGHPLTEDEEMELNMIKFSLPSEDKGVSEFLNLVSIP